MTLNAIVQELANQDEVTQSVNFTVYIKPVASLFEILTNDIVFGSDRNTSLKLNLDLLDQRGTDVGETPQEIITLNFTNVPSSTFLFAGKGGRLSNPSPGNWVFTGTQTQANDGLQLVNVNQTAGLYFVSVEGVTRDGQDVLATPISDDFPFKVSVASPAQGLSLTTGSGTATGTVFNDILRASSTGVILNGNDGMDLLYAFSGTTMTGGSGSDQFVFRNPAVSINVINDFTPGQNGDVLNVGALVDPNFNLQLGQISQVVRIIGAPGVNREIEVFDGTAWRKVVRIASTLDATVTVDSLWSNGNLLV